MVTIVDFALRAAIDYFKIYKYYKFFDKEKNSNSSYWTNFIMKALFGVAQPKQNKTYYYYY